MNTKEQLRDQRNLMKALKSNDYVGAKMRIKAMSIDLYFLDNRMNCSPLMFEVGRKKCPSIIMMQYLLDHGAIIDFRNRFGMTALHLLMSNKKLSLGLLTFLLRHGANPNATNNEGDSPLHCACICTNTNAVRYLLEYCNGRDQSNNQKTEGTTDSNIQPIDVNCINNNGDTPLMLATKHFKANRKVVVELVQILLDFKSEINVVNKQNCSALHFAAKNGLSKVVDLLVHQGADVNIVDDEDLSPLEYACRLKNVNSIGSLLTFHADVNRQNRYGRTPIYLLADVGHGHSSCETGRCFRLLLENGVNVKIQDHNGETPLSYAVRCCLGLSRCRQQSEMEYLIRDLIEEESDINIQLCNSIGNLVNGDTILHYAVKGMNWRMVNTILHNNPDLHIRNCHQETASDIANKLYDQNDDDCQMIFHLINNQLEMIRRKTYSYLLQSWIMPGPAMTHIPCPPTKKRRQK